MAQSLTPSSSHHKVNEEKTGREIAKEIISVEINKGTKDEQVIVSALTGGDYPLEIVQQGRLTKLLTAAEELASENSRLIQENGKLGEELLVAQERIELLRAALREIN